MNLPWPYIPHIPSYFYRIYLPSINNMSSILNSNYDSFAFSPMKSTPNSTNRYENEFFSDQFNSNSIDNPFLLPSNQQTNLWSNPQVRSNLFSLQNNSFVFQTSSYVSDRHSNLGRIDYRSTDDITVSIRWWKPRFVPLLVICFDIYCLVFLLQIFLRCVKPDVLCSLFLSLLLFSSFEWSGKRILFWTSVSIVRLTEKWIQTHCAFPFLARVTTIRKDNKRFE